VNHRLASVYSQGHRQGPAQEGDLVAHGHAHLQARFAAPGASLGLAGLEDHRFPVAGPWVARVGKRVDRVGVENEDDGAQEIGDVDPFIGGQGLDIVPERRRTGDGVGVFGASRRHVPARCFALVLSDRR